MYFTLYHSPLGKILLAANKQGLTQLTFIDHDEAVLNNVPLSADNKFLCEACQQLDQYFAKQRSQFTIKLAPQGTAFQQQVWQALTTIEQGETKSYAWLAKTINNPKAVRAVGRANGANPIALIIPCHRVIGANGKLTGYAGGLSLKAKLLAFEGAEFIAE